MCVYIYAVIFFPEKKITFACIGEKGFVSEEKAVYISYSHGNLSKLAYYSRYLNNYEALK